LNLFGEGNRIDDAVRVEVEPVHDAACGSIVPVSFAEFAEPGEEGDDRRAGAGVAQSVDPEDAVSSSRAGSVKVLTTPVALVDVWSGPLIVERIRLRVGVEADRARMRSSVARPWRSRSALR
jgi:hypothetical protein